MNVTDNWRDKALCVGLDSNIFFSDDGDVSKALKICTGCSAKEPCLEYALEFNVEFGVWGATTGPERRALRRKMNIGRTGRGRGKKKVAEQEEVQLEGA